VNNLLRAPVLNIQNKSQALKKLYLKHSCLYKEILKLLLLNIKSVLPDKKGKQTYYSKGRLQMKSSEKRKVPETSKHLPN
jgi:hypothetical protein